MKQEPEPFGVEVLLSFSPAWVRNTTESLAAAFPSVPLRLNHLWFHTLDLSPVCVCVRMSDYSDQSAPAVESDVFADTVEQHCLNHCQRSLSVQTARLCLLVLVMWLLLLRLCAEPGTTSYNTNSQVINCLWIKTFKICLSCVFLSLFATISLHFTAECSEWCRDWGVQKSTCCLQWQQWSSYDYD